MGLSVRTEPLVATRVPQGRVAAVLAEVTRVVASAVHVPVGECSSAVVLPTPWPELSDATPELWVSH